MNKVAQFYKVSLEQFIKDLQVENAEISIEDIKKVYDNIKLPKRATKGSAGYDFFSPFSFTLEPNEVTKIPTSIRCQIDEGYVLLIFVRSSLGFKYQTVLTNGTGVIDSDYFGADNEGHIFVKLRNDGDKTLNVSVGDALVQGVFVPFAITQDDNADGIRIGGTGSTSKKKGE